MASQPRPGDRILVLKWHWLSMILKSEKTMEIRGICFRRGRYFLGFQRNIYGWIELGDPIRMNIAQWKELRHRHRVQSENLPYKKTFGIPILHAQALTPTIPYKHPRGAVSIVKFR